MPNGYYLEIFGRRNNLHNGWVTIGNEIWVNSSLLTVELKALIYYSLNRSLSLNSCSLWRNHWLIYCAEPCSCGLCKKLIFLSLVKLLNFKHRSFFITVYLPIIHNINQSLIILNHLLHLPNVLKWQLLEFFHFIWFSIKNQKFLIFFNMSLDFVL